MTDLELDELVSAVSAIADTYNPDELRAVISILSRELGKTVGRLSLVELVESAAAPWRRRQRHALKRLVKALEDEALEKHLDELAPGLAGSVRGLVDYE